MANNIFSFVPVEEAKSISGEEAVKGVILGVVFGLIATIPWIIVTNSGWFVSLLGYLIGLATYKGFVLGAGKMHRLGRITIVLFVLIAIPLAEFVIIIMQGMQLGYSFAFVIANTPAIFIAGLGRIADSILMGYLFAFLGVYRFLIPHKKVAPANVPEQK